MGHKRFVWSTQKKHHWHRNFVKAKHLDKLFDKVMAEKVHTNKVMTRCNQNLGVLKENE